MVTLSMEVSYPFHSYLIGRSGANINKVMEQTNTRIHFPDQNRICGQKKSNLVVIRGSMTDVENARQLIRVSNQNPSIFACLLVYSMLRFH